MKTVFLSASVPTKERSAEFHRVPNAHINIEEAVINLCRAVFNRGGRVAFGGHPSISPLVSMVAAEFRHPTETENEKKSVIIYQSEAFRTAFLTKTLATLDRLGTTEIRVTQAVSNEKYDDKIKNKKQCPRSLNLMRDTLLADQPDMMVCIGGMEGVIEEYEKFLAHEGTRHKPVILLPYTGGATHNLLESKRPDNVIVFNKESLKTKISGKDIDLHIYPHAAISEDIVNILFSDRHQI